MELLAALSVVSILFGVSVATLSRIGRGPALEVAGRQVRGALNRARTSAREQAAIGEVVLEPGSEAGDSAILRVRRTVDAGSWHFDLPGSVQGGGRNHDATLKGPRIEDGGFIRSCVGFENGGVVECPAYPIYDPSRGVDLTMMVSRATEDGGGALASYGDAFRIEITDDGALLAFVTLAEDAGTGALKTEPECVAPDRWASVRFTFDGLEARLFVHEVLEASQRFGGPEESPNPKRLAAPIQNGQLVFGSKEFRGRLDEIVYRTVEEDDPIPLAERRGVQIVPQQLLRLRFSSDGRLDPRVHFEDVTITLRDEDGGTRTILVDRSGVLR